MAFLIPVDRLRETPTLIAFYHPAPSYAVHILIVPKRRQRDLTALTAADADFTVELFQTVASLVDDLHLSAYRLICNGGEYQDVPHLHFHLVSDTFRDKNV